ncbi:MAG: glycosyltransferase family 2 protein [Vicingaceae bacterium]
MERPLISVVIPCYNIEKYARRAIYSIINQSYTNLEIILVEDGSSDGTRSILESLKIEDARIKLIYNVINQGLAISLNKAIESAQGDFIARMDGDDISHPNRLQEQLDYLISHPKISVVGCKAIPINESSQPLAFFEFTYCNSSTLKVSSFLANPFIHGSILVRKEILKKYSYKEIGSEDFEIWCNMNSKGERFANLNKELYYFRKNQTSYSNLNELNQILSHNKTSKKYLSKFRNQNLNQEVVDIINHRPMKKVSYPEFIDGLKILNEYISEFSTKTKEFKLFIANQYYNIYIQSFKKADSLSLKVRLILLFIKWLFKLNGFQFLRLKTSKKIINGTLKRRLNDDNTLDDKGNFVKI